MLYYFDGLRTLHQQAEREAAGKLVSEDVVPRRGRRETLSPQQAAWFHVPSLLDELTEASVTSQSLGNACSYSGFDVELQLFLVGLTTYRPRLMAGLLLQSCVDHARSQRVAQRNGSTTPKEFRRWFESNVEWRSARASEIPAELRGAAAVFCAPNLASRGTHGRLNPEADALEVLQMSSEDPDVRLAGLLAELDELEAHQSFGEPNAGFEKRYVEERIDEYLEPSMEHVVLTMLPWLLAWNSRNANRFAAVAAAEHETALDALSDLAEQHGRVGHLAVLAAGLRATLVDPTAGRFRDADAWLSNRRYFGRPQSMRAPSGTWLGSAELESMIRYRADNAAERWRWAGATQEEHMTGALAEQLVDQLAGISSVAGGGGGIRLEAKMTRKVDEKNTGADLGVVVRVDLPRQLAVTTGHLVQIKRSNNAPGRWSIGVPQLMDLVTRDPHGTYWLLSSNVGSRVICVPATYLLGRFRSIHPHKRTGSYSVTHAEVSSAAIPLGDLLCDLLLGLWVGSTKQSIVADAVGSSDYYPAILLDLTLRGQ